MATTHQIIGILKVVMADCTDNISTSHGGIKVLWNITNESLKSNQNAVPQTT